MLRRLIKHDMRAIAKTAVPMFIASGAVSIICCAVLYFTFSFAEEINSVFNAIIVTGSLYLLGGVAICSMFIVVGFVVIGRYYKSVFTDEGYLNMVLPVTRKTLLNAKIISSIVWFALVSLAAWACAVIAVILPTLLYDTSLFSSVFDAVKKVLGMGEIKTTEAIAASLIKIFISVFSSVKDVMILITAVTVGAVLIKQLKVFACVIFYFIITFIEDIITDLLNAVMRSIFASNPWMSLVLQSLLELAVIIGVSSVMYFISLRIFERKFDIE